MDGMEATTDLFINLIQNNRIIYDKTLKDFKNTRKKEEVWQNIAVQSRMGVDSAKKRYISLRQKYSREKRNREEKRRKKISVTRNWVYYDRLQFLDSFVQPRATYTNDKFVEDDDDVTLDGNDIESSKEASGDATQTVDIEVEDGINTDEFEDLFGGDTGLHDVHVERQTSRIDQNNFEHVQSEEIVRSRIERIVSEYSQQESEYQPPIVHSLTSRDNNASVREALEQSENCQQPENGQQPEDADIVDIDNYMSPTAHTSSSLRNPSIPPYPSRCYDPKTGEIVIARPEKTGNHIRMQTSVSNCHLGNGSSSQHHQSSSIQKTSAVPRQPLRSNRILTTSSAESSFRSNQPQSTARIQQPIVPTALPSASSKEKQLDAIRQRMENCLTALTNKVSDKAQRSPHGPFLSYLGTKLPLVQKENLPRLEKEILDLVDHFIN